MQHAAEIPYSFTVELPDTGSYGFILPPSQIKTVGEELWAATAVVSQNLGLFFNFAAWLRFSL